MLLQLEASALHADLKSAGVISQSPLRHTTVTLQGSVQLGSPDQTAVQSQLTVQNDTATKVALRGSKLESNRSGGMRSQRSSSVAMHLYLFT